MQGPHRMALLRVSVMAIIAIAALAYAFFFVGFR